MHIPPGTPSPAPGERRPALDPSAPTESFALPGRTTGPAPSSGSGRFVDPDAIAQLPLEVQRALADSARRLGRHVLLGELGRGGMGVVHRGFDLALRRPVAVKRVLHAALAGEDALRRFAREARAAARLRHPGIVAVHEVGEHDGTPYLVMDLVDGESLDARLRHGPLPPRRAATMALALAGALGHAHREGIVHRDVKPQNVLLDRDGHPFLTDFGLARETGSAAGITRTGAFVGTPGYAPPEQVSGDLGAVGPTSDVYALGAVLYHALTGVAPFGGQSAMEVILASLRDDPVPPSRLERSVHIDLETITLRCLAKDSAARYRSAGALAEDLRRFLEGEPILARPIGRLERFGRLVRRHRMAAALLTAVALLTVAGLVGGAVFLRLERERSRRAERERVVGEARAEADAATSAFEGACAEAVPEAPEARRRHFDALIARGLEAVQASGRLRALVPGDAEAARSCFEASMGLGEIALRAEQWSVASSAFEGAVDLDVDRARAQAALARVERARTSRDDDRRRAVERVLQRVRSGAVARQPGGYDDALFELVGYRDADTVAILAHALDEVAVELVAASRALLLSAEEPDEGERRAGLERIERLREAVDVVFPAAPPSRPLPMPEPLVRDAIAAASERIEAREGRRRAPEAVRRRIEFAEIHAAEQARRVGEGPLLLARLCCEALGRIGIADGAIDALGRCLLVEADELRAIPAAIALLQLGGEGAIDLVEAAGRRLGEDGPFWRQVARHLPERSVGSATPIQREDPAAYLQRGLARLETGQLPGALADLTRAIELESSLARAWAERGLVHQRLGDPVAAMADFDRAVELAPHKAEAWNRRAGLRQQLGDYEGALADYTRAIEAAPSYANGWANRALAREALDDLDGALLDVSRAIELQPKAALFWTRRGRIRMKRGDLDGALADCTRAIELDARLAAARVVRGNAWRLKGALDDALTDLSAAIRLDPSDPDAWTTRAIVHGARGDDRAAMADARRAVEVGERNAYAWAMLAGLRLDAGEVDGALEDASRAIALDARTAEAWRTRAFAREKKGDLRGAVDDAERFVHLAPWHPSHEAMKAWLAERRARLGGGG